VGNESEVVVRFSQMAHAKGTTVLCTWKMKAKFILFLPPTSQVGSIQILLTKGTPKVIENGVVACVHVT